MERYNSNYDNDNSLVQDVPSRVSRNDSLYQDIRNSEIPGVRNDSNVKVIENSGKTIDIDKIKKYINDINDQPRSRRRNVFDVPIEDNKAPEREVKPKDYDINSVLEKAKQSREVDYERERYKKLRDTQYDILSKLEIYDDKEVKTKEDDKLTRDDFNTEEKTLIDLINTVTIHNGDVNLLEDLVGGDDEETTLPISEELNLAGAKASSDNFGNTTVSNLLDSISKDPEIASGPHINKTLTRPKIDVSIDNDDKTRELSSLKDKTIKADDSFYTNSMSFSKEDFEGFDEIEKNVKKSSVLTTILVVIFIISIIVSIVVILNYVLKLGLF